MKKLYKATCEFMAKKDFEWALVTGASSGIGEQLCYLFADRGINLIIVARSTDKLESMAKELGEKVKVEVCSADLADRTQRKPVIEKIRERVPDLVVNNAGWGYYGEALTFETQESMNMLEVDVAAVLELSLEAARTLVTHQKPGVIMNVSSVSAFQVFPCLSVYAASKAFLNLFSESFDEEMRSYGIRVLATCPGMVDTGFRLRASRGQQMEPNPYSMTSRFAAEEIWWQIEKEKSLHIFDWKYRIAAFFTRYLLPKRLIARVVRRAIEDLHPPRDIITR